MLRLILKCIFYFIIISIELFKILIFNYSYEDGGVTFEVAHVFVDDSIDGVDSGN